MHQAVTTSKPCQMAQHENDKSERASERSDQKPDAQVNMENQLNGIVHRALCSVRSLLIAVFGRKADKRAV